MASLENTDVKDTMFSVVVHNLGFRFSIIFSFIQPLLLYSKVFVLTYPSPPQVGALDMGPYSRIDSEKFATDVLDEFDLDICRMGIYKDQYINR